MTTTGILYLLASAVGGWAIRHYFPGLLGGGAATPVPVVPAPPAAPHPAGSLLGSLLSGLLQELIKVKTSPAGLSALELELAQLLHVTLGPLVDPAPSIQGPLPPK